MIFTKDGKTLAYEIKRKKIKHTYLRLKNQKVIISTPYHTEEAYLLQLLATHFTKFYEATTRVNLPNNTCMLWGNLYQVKEKKMTDPYEIDTLALTVYVKAGNSQEHTLAMLYQQETEKQIAVELATMIPHIKAHNIMFSSIRVKPMTTRYGSCSYHKKTISINRNLSKIDPVYLRYVLYHEFAHLRHPNHSSAYHAFLRVLFPQSVEVRKSLKKQRIS